MTIGRGLSVFLVGVFAVLLGTTNADAWFKFKNNTTKRISVAFMWHKQNCAANQSHWAVASWWNLNPGETKTVYSDDLQDNNRFYYFYAFDEGGGEWTGLYRTCVPSRKSDWCDNVCDTSPGMQIVGFREVDVGENNNYTINLQP